MGVSSAPGMAKVLCISLVSCYSPLSSAPTTRSSHLANGLCVTESPTVEHAGSVVSSISSTGERSILAIKGSELPDSITTECKTPISGAIEAIVEGIA